ncbi:hypothetical protein C8R45DRAFT_246099 [Mycena sanguinolenta]|nr:hypothetical protein C8R45DRAFT_246099 [Mycena sanguinolenta]
MSTQNAPFQAQYSRRSVSASQGAERQLQEFDAARELASGRPHASSRGSRLQQPGVVEQYRLPAALTAKQRAGVPICALLIPVVNGRSGAFPFRPHWRPRCRTTATSGKARARATPRRHGIQRALREALYLRISAVRAPQRETEAQVRLWGEMADINPKVRWRSWSTTTTRRNQTQIGGVRVVRTASCPRAWRRRGCAISFPAPKLGVVGCSRRLVMCHGRLPPTPQISLQIMSDADGAWDIAPRHAFADGA